MFQQVKFTALTHLKCEICITQQATANNARVFDLYACEEVKMCDYYVE